MKFSLVNKLRHVNVTLRHLCPEYRIKMVFYFNVIINTNL